MLSVIQRIATNTCRDQGPCFIRMKKKPDIMDVTYKSGINYLIGWFGDAGMLPCEGSISRATFHLEQSWGKANITSFRSGPIATTSESPFQGRRYPTLSFCSQRKGPIRSKCICIKRSWLLSRLDYKSWERKVEKENFSLSNLTWVSQSLQLMGKEWVENL